MHAHRGNHIEYFRNYSPSLRSESPVKVELYPRYRRSKTFKVNGGDAGGGAAQTEKSEVAGSGNVTSQQLVDEPFAPGHDKGSCLSRYESGLYRKLSSHKPSPYLFSKLGSNESLHHNLFGPNSYNKTIASAFPFTLSSQTGPDEKQDNGTSAPEFLKQSGSRNDSSQSSRMPDDKLLGGLLAPGFDERSCLSRYRSSLFRKISPHKPSSYLLSKLRRYEDLHKRCGPRTKSYKKAFKRLKSGHGSSGGCNYLVWIPVNGLGNRMISLASTFLYALLTDRVLLVEVGNDMSGLFCEPFPNSSWILPKSFSHTVEFRNHYERYARGYGNQLKNGIINESMESINILPPPFFLTPTFNQEVQRMFPERETVFHHLGRYLFHPSNEAWGRIIRFYQAYLANADERIGLQIRVFNTKTTKAQTVLDELFKCTQKEKLLPQVDPQNPAAAPIQNQRSKAILVTSLYTEFYENISNTYWAKPTVTGEVIGVYQPSHDETQHFGDNMQNMKAWAEMYLLSMSDVLVTSGWSTFGYVAQGLGGLKPWVLYKIEEEHTRNPSCVRDLSMEPCFHHPPTYDCRRKKKMNAGSLFPYLKYCEDLNWGVKLVSDHQ
ncbi:2-ALPHA-L-FUCOSYLTRANSFERASE putative-RELATED [Salix viminalis]|uniref:Fucosyltransferase n=1 Tax=Salix viminalis TaxID=40686 RepID=A0A9Q0QAC5_SALVM|nr:2-ALPHA-L-FUCOSYLTRANSFERASE putative-RELATED [Salix viminalis]